MENHKFLINTVLVILICGVILASIGNYILYKFSNNKTLNLKTCNEKLLEEANRRRGNNDINGYTLAFTGYIVIAMGLLFLIILSTFFSVNSKKSDRENIKNIITGNLPIFLSLLVASYIISLNIKYKENLISGKVSSEFFSYLSYFSLIFIIQIVALSKYISELAQNKDIQIGSAIIAFSVINILILGIINIILVFFTTDG